MQVLFAWSIPLLSKVPSSTWQGLQWSGKQSQYPELPPTVQGAHMAWTPWEKQGAQKCGPATRGPREARGTRSPEHELRRAQEDKLLYLGDKYLKSSVATPVLAFDLYFQV